MDEILLSTDEAELYDRQIRLWGIEAQEKLRAASVLIIKVRGLGSEIAKNVLLIGVDSLTILDDGVVTEDVIAKNFMLPWNSCGEKIADAVLQYAQALNPLVKITSVTDPVEKMQDDFFKEFAIVIGTELNRSQILKVSQICRNNEVKFICGDNFGTFGYSMADFQEHDYFEDRVQYVRGHKRTRDGLPCKQVERTKVRVAAKLRYPALSKVLKLPDAPIKHNRRNVYFYLMLSLLEFRTKHSRTPDPSSKKKDMKELKAIIHKILSLYHVKSAKIDRELVLNKVFDEIVPVCAIVGGVMAQEVIKAVSGKEVPLHNVFLLDPITSDGREEKISI